jgi:oxygen-independent coproporphyrinogen-3 oxidase
LQRKRQTSNDKKMQIPVAGLYIHIPFCQSRCIYCGFYSTTAMALRQRYVDAVCREMQMRSISPTPSPTRECIETIYFGGGTPSQLSPAQLRQLYLYIYKVYDVAPDAEVTIEVNPDDVTTAFAALLAELPVNRVSMGAQTFDDNRLNFLHRRHSAAQVPQAVRCLREADIRNISIDLMYGFPGETLDDWQRDVDAALALDVEHLSAYCLMVEEGTPLFEQMKGVTPSDSPCLGGEHDAAKTSPIQGSMEGSAEELERQMYEVLTDRLTAGGYEHYEISNFAKPGYRSRHNSSYWNDVPYIGLGAAAHSYDGKRRYWNVADIHQYMEAIERGERPCDGELLDGDTRYNDRITVALRTCEGLDLATLSERQRTFCLDAARRFLNDGLLRLDGQHLVLTRKGLFVSDMIMAELMIV